MEVKGNLKSFKASWVKAYQDSKRSINELPLKAQPNVTSDKDVNAFRETQPPSLKPLVNCTNGYMTILLAGHCKTYLI
eukprot:14833515-Ditylum_brightwellii.AAC.2